MSSLAEQIANLLPNGLGARGDEERNPLTYPARSLHVLLATSGSVASIKAPLIVCELLKYEQVDVQVVATKSSLHFFDWKALEEEHGGRVKVWTDSEEWEGWSKIGDPILHIEVSYVLRRWADIVLVAPCSANTLAKITHGICDNILTSLVRALPTFVPVLLFPAMNTHMYSHPLTAKQLKSVTEELGYEVHGPIAKTLACGDIGLGAMTEWSEVVKLVVNKYELKAK
ncbi:flavo protein [Leucosporidium creatinivorum]|uniref:Flavo protein n=1 Tax=Leucosporidium creatinivorum TaxID=106004 RepID=A0A1Y2G1B1_9BASI|nr:flavo protein [Leucosporidium creatinivorum]